MTAAKAPLVDQSSIYQNGMNRNGYGGSGNSGSGSRTWKLRKSFDKRNLTELRESNEGREEGGKKKRRKKRGGRNRSGKRGMANKKEARQNEILDDINDNDDTSTSLTTDKITKLKKGREPICYKD
mmetsp:Transcript_27841/g.57973  ORF Transcript_27841/g.57973 Transcript_27841/m.57973 type:complete len:126 (+) Transcript_27841:724-1101(+)